MSTQPKEPEIKPPYWAAMIKEKDATIKLQRELLEKALKDLNTLEEIEAKNMKLPNLIVRALVVRLQSHLGEM